MPRLLGSGRLPHAMLLTGVDAIGKRSLAFAMAKAILSAGRHIHPGEINAPAPAPAKRKMPDPGEDDLFGDMMAEEEPDLFGDFGGEEEIEEEPYPPPPPEAPKAEEKKPSKPKPGPAPEQTFTPAPRAVFRGFDERVCRLVEASYPLEHDKDNRPANISHFDLHIVEPIGNRRGIVVDQIRYLQDIARIAPVEGHFRVVLIFGADTITQEGGNSILKLLEEPPRFLVMILVANRLGGVLPTIRSRCTVVPMMPLPRDVLVEKLMEEENLRPELAKVAAALSEGRPGIALNAIQADLLQRRRDVFEARLQLDRFGTPALPAVAARIQAAGSLEESLWLLLSYARDRLVRAAVPDQPELLVHGDAVDLIDAVSPDSEDLDDEAARLVEAYQLLSHPFLPNQRAALQLALWP